MKRLVEGVLLVVAGSGLLLWAGEARAQTAGCTVHAAQEARQQEARTRFQQGQQLVEAERFAEALADFECSFQNVPHPSTLYNIARAAEFSGQFRRALDAWRGYLRMNPEAEDRADIERRIAALESAGSPGPGSPGTVQAGDGAGLTGMGQPSPPPTGAAAPQSWETPEGAPTDVYSPAEPGQEYQVVEHRMPSPWRYYAWYIMGTGALSALVGLYLLIPDSGIDGCYRDDGAFDAVSACAITSFSLIGVGAALVISAALIWIFAEPGGEYVVTRRASLAPQLAFDDHGRLIGALASWSMRF